MKSQTDSLPCEVSDDISSEAFNIQSLPIILVDNYNLDLSDNMILSGQQTEGSNIQILSDIPFNESELFGKALVNNMDILTSERTL